MIVDSSALVAVAYAEPEAASFLTTMQGAERCLIAAPTLLETSMVLWPLPTERVAELVLATGVEVVAFGPEHLAAAQSAFAHYGKGNGSRAQLNFGDCISYALAKVTGEQLLFKGDDFTHTDIEAAWLPA